MVKVLLVTLHSINIGNRLQNFALQNTLENLNFTVYNPIYSLKEPMSLKEKVIYFVKLVLGIVNVKKYRKIIMDKKRKIVFERFDNEFINNKFLVNFDNIYIDNWENYDYAITGSDQVWHKWFNDIYELPYFYLDFMPNDKRIAYAASFGFSYFNPNDKEIHRKGINNMRFISCREKRGQELIYSLTNKKAEIVLDPTMLLTVDEWRQIEKKPKYKVKQKYILVYFLGKFDFYRQDIKEFAIRNDLQIINIFDIEDEKHYCTSPEEFIWLVENAMIIFTDSFHACVFSILFHKSFKVFRRKEIGFEDMFDRVESLLNTFRLQDNIFDGNNIDELNVSDWNYVEDILQILREQSMDFLCNALNI